MEQTKKYDVFVSYRRDDTDKGSSYARVVCAALHKAGFSYFLDKDKMPSGPFPDSIDTAIRQSLRFVFIVNGDSWRAIQDGKDDWYYQEIGRASVYLGVNCMTPVVAQKDEYNKFREGRLPQDIVDYFKYRIIANGSLTEVDISSVNFRQLNKINYSTDDNFCDEFKKHLGLEKKQATNGAARGNTIFNIGSVGKFVNQTVENGNITNNF